MAKATIYKMNTQPTEWEKIFANGATPKYTNSCSPLLKKQASQAKSGHKIEKNRNRHPSKEEV